MPIEPTITRKGRHREQSYRISLTAGRAGRTFKKMQRTLICACAAALIALVTLALSPTARACIEDSVGLELIDGELPGGG
jgi:hypothetical protein